MQAMEFYSLQLVSVVTTVWNKKLDCIIHVSAFLFPTCLADLDVNLLIYLHLLLYIIMGYCCCILCVVFQTFPRQETGHGLLELDG